MKKLKKLLIVLFSFAVVIVIVSSAFLSKHFNQVQHITKSVVKSKIVISSTATTAIPKIPVNNLWQSGKTQLGINLLCYVNSPQESLNQISKQANLDMNYIVGLNANSVSIDFPFYMKNGKASVVFAGNNTPTISQLGVIINAALKRGLRVTIRPLLDEADLGVGFWRGNIQPTNVKSWFNSYQQFLIPYAKLAQNYKVSTFIIGAELNSLVKNARWSTLVNNISQKYSYQIGYSDNWDTFHAGIQPSSISRIGVDSYFPVAVSSTATIQQLTNAWNKWWNTLPKNINISKTVIDEVGIAAQNGAYKEPYVLSIAGKPLNSKIQVNWFTAACNTVLKYHLAGIYFWDISLNESPKISSSVTSFVGQPGETEIRSCFSVLSS